MDITKYMHMKNSHCSHISLAEASCIAPPGLARSITFKLHELLAAQKTYAYIAGARFSDEMWKRNVSGKVKKIEIQSSYCVRLVSGHHGRGLLLRRMFVAPTLVKLS